MFRVKMMNRATPPVLFLMVFMAVNSSALLLLLNSLAIPLSLSQAVLPKLLLVGVSSVAVLSLLEYRQPLIWRQMSLLPRIVFVALMMIAIVQAIRWAWPVEHLKPHGPFRHTVEMIFALEGALYVFYVHLMSQRETAQRLRMQLQSSELALLRNQTHPHFLFNTLNLIADGIEHNPVAARETLYDLSDLLRCGLQNAKRALNTVARELQWIELFLKLQQKRFESRFEYQMDCPENCRQLAMPALLLQPLVENAMKHGIAPFARRGRVKVGLWRDEQWLHIRLSDTGKLSPETERGQGEGLRLVRQALTLAYQDQFDFGLHVIDQGTEVRIRLPAREFV